MKPKRGRGRPRLDPTREIVSRVSLKAYENYQAIPWGKRSGWISRQLERLRPRFKKSEDKERLARLIDSFKPHPSHGYSKSDIKRLTPSAPVLVPESPSTIIADCIQTAEKIENILKGTDNET